MDEQRLQELIEKFLQEYGDVGRTEVCGQEFFWRPLTRKEYKYIATLEIPPEEKEELICHFCVFYPESYDFSNCPAGIPTTLSREILMESGFSYDGNPNPVVRQWLEEFRKEMFYFENQVDCVIVEAFPTLNLEEVANWTNKKTMYYLSRAEWVLTQLRGIPLIDVATGKPIAYDQSVEIPGFEGKGRKQIGEG